MTGRLDAETVRWFILENVGDHPGDIASVVAEHFDVSRQTAHARLKKLVDAGDLTASGHARHRRYAVAGKIMRKVLSVAAHQDEDSVYRRDVAPELEGLPDNILKVCYYGFTEMFNNVIDHSEAESVSFVVERSPISVTLKIHDFGVGIFEKIQRKLNLDDPRQSILELSKGKFTTDPKRHSGEGIYFTSRMFDEFFIGSGKLVFLHRNIGDWLVESEPANHFQGTYVSMNINIMSKTTPQSIFEKFTYETSEEEYGFARTHVPLSLAVYSPEGLISRSQAKRVLQRFERFKEVMLDFAGIDSIGQPFADEIFRVFRNAHPEIKVVPIGANPAVLRMIEHVTRRT